MAVVRAEFTVAQAARPIDEPTAFSPASGCFVGREEDTVRNLDSATVFLEPARPEVNEPKIPDGETTAKNLGALLLGAARGSFNLRPDECRDILLCLRYVHNVLPPLQAARILCGSLLAYGQRTLRGEGPSSFEEVYPQFRKAVVEGEKRTRLVGWAPQSQAADSECREAHELYINTSQAVQMLGQKFYPAVSQQ